MENSSLLLLAQIYNLVVTGVPTDPVAPKLLFLQSKTPNKP